MFVCSFQRNGVCYFKLLKEKEWEARMVPLAMRSTKKKVFSGENCQPFLQSGGPYPSMLIPSRPDSFLKKSRMNAALLWPQEISFLLWRSVSQWVFPKAGTRVSVKAILIGGDFRGQKWSAEQWHREAQVERAMCFYLVDQYSAPSHRTLWGDLNISFTLTCRVKRPLSMGSCPIFQNCSYKYLLPTLVD